MEQYYFIIGKCVLFAQPQNLAASMKDVSRSAVLAKLLHCLTTCVSEHS